MVITKIEQPREPAFSGFRFSRPRPRPAKKTDDDFRDLAQNCDLLVVPAVPESVATDGLTLTLAKLHELNQTRYKVLTMVPPKPRTEGDQLRAMLNPNPVVSRP